MKENKKYQETIQKIQELDSNKVKIFQGFEGQIFNINYNNKNYIIKSLNFSNNEKEAYEIIAAKNHKHPHIGKYYGYYQSNGFTNLVLKEYENPPYFTDDDSFDTLKLTPNERSKIINNVVKGLAFIHNLGYRYGDLKLENILYDPKTQNYRLIDFGFMSQDSKFSSLYSLEKNKIIGYGTLFCLAPEICLLASPKFRNNPFGSLEKDLLLTQISRKNDIWSLGVLIFELYTTKSPFQEDEDTDDKIIENIKSKTIRHPDSWLLLEPEIRELLDSQLWIIKPNDRPNLTDIIFPIRYDLHNLSED